ncbi:Cof subfamily protein (haloacid dehalogenase superfamily) [Mammaliicoccus lentus]
MIKVIFSDIDGTLLNTKHEISQNTKDKISEVLLNNIPFILVSARMPSGMFYLQNELGISLPIVSYSGTLILEKKNESTQILYSETLTTNDSKQIYSIINEQFKTINLSLYSYDQWIQQEKEITNVDSVEFSLYEFIKQHEVHKYLCMSSPKEIDALELELKRLLPHLTIYKSKDTYLEIMYGNASKSNAIKN